MKNTNDNIKKMCTFYMSDWHFTVMLLPYINKEINMKTQIFTIFENDITQKVKTLVDKLNLKNKDQILKINWKNADINNIIYQLENKLKNNDNNIVIINGTNNYIKEVNKKLEEVIYNDKFLQKNIKIIDCYDFEENKEKINTIIGKYDSMVNTSGEIKVENIF